MPRVHRATPESSILLVEDDPAIVMVLEALFADEGFQCTVCNDGNSAYEVIVASQPSLVILDLLLPGRDGMDVLARVKGDPRTSAIPILVCSAAESQIQRSAPVLELWSCQVLSKPFDLDVLMATVYRTLASEHPSPLVIKASE